MTKGYLNAQVTVTDGDAYARYAGAAGPLPRTWGARVAVDPASLVVLEGHPRARTVIFEFEDAERAKAFWDSEEYIAAKALMIGAAEADFLLVAGAA